MIAFPNIKINLGLHITERRSDNYHNLLTCFYPVSWSDILEIVPSEKFHFSQTGLPVPGAAHDNLCVRAYRLLKNDYYLPEVNIHLHKIIPTGSGLGGGSSDAAFVLKTLRDVFHLDISEQKLEQYAAQLGSDCAFFVRNQPVVAKSRGEEMQNVGVDLKGTCIYIVCPHLHVSTAEAFTGVRPRPFADDFVALLKDKSQWKEHLHNQFEETIFPKYPPLAEIKQQLYDAGAWYASMSGSGSAIFGLFEKEPNVDFSGCDTYKDVL